MKKFLLMLAFIACNIMFVDSQNAELMRNPKWATAVTEVSMDNMYRIDSGVYRSEQPTAQEFKILEDFGIKEVLNLRNHNSDNDEARGTNLILRRVKMQAHDIDTDEVVDALRVIKNRTGDILIHCKHGSDRTGLILAMYRIVFQDWTKEEALDEMKNGGFNYHSVFFNIPRYLEKIDVEKIKNAINQ